MLLAQLYAKDDNAKKLRAAFYNSEDQKIFKLHPSLKHELIENIQKNLKPWKGLSTLKQYIPIYGSNTRWLEHKRYVDFIMALTPAQSAAFIPYMRVFTKTRQINSSGAKNNSNPWFDRDIVFKTFTDLDPILNENYTRGASAGIKSLSMKRHLQAFGASQSFYLDLNFFFSSMKTFTNGHQEDLSRGWTEKDYIKLIKPLGGATTECRDGVETKIPEEWLNIEYGWKIADNVPYDLIPREIREIIQRKEKKSFALRWISHSFKFNETGEIELSVNYMGTPEHMMYKNSTDIDEEQNDITGLGNKIAIQRLEEPEFQKKHEDLAKKKKALKVLLACPSTKKKTKDETKREECHKKDKNKEITKLTKEIASIKKKIISKTSGVALDHMIDKNQVFYATFTSAEKKPKNKSKSPKVFKLQVGLRGAKNFQEVGKATQGFVSKDYITVLKTDDAQTKAAINKIKDQLEYVEIIDKKTKKPKKPISSLEKELDKVMSALTNSEEKKLYGNFFFFPAKALIEWAYHTMGSDKKKEMPIICLGNMVTRSLGKEYWVNIGDVLIEVGVFQKWFYEELIAKERSKMTLGDFMDSVMDVLIPRALYGFKSGYTPNTNHGSIRPYFYQATHQKVVDIFKKVPGGKKDPTTTARELADLIKKKEDNAIPFIYYSQKAPTDLPESPSGLFFQSAANRTFDKVRDHADGMYHFTIGEDKGLLRTIDFSYDDDPLLRNGLLRDRGSDGITPFLKFIYKANATLMGNNLFTDGAWFVLPNNPLGGRKEDDPGLLG